MQNLHLTGTSDAVAKLHSARDKGKGVATGPDTHEAPFLSLDMGTDTGGASFMMPDDGLDDDNFQIHGNKDLRA